MINDHCRQYRGKMLDRVTFDVVAKMIDGDLAEWTSVWLTKTLAFRKKCPIPPNIEDMPPVIGPQWIAQSHVSVSSRRHRRSCHVPDQA